MGAKDSSDEQRHLLSLNIGDLHSTAKSADQTNRSTDSAITSPDSEGRRQSDSDDQRHLISDWGRKSLSSGYDSARAGIREAGIKAAARVQHKVEYFTGSVELNSSGPGPTEQNLLSTVAQFVGSGDGNDETSSRHAEAIARYNSDSSNNDKQSESHDSESKWDDRAYKQHFGIIGYRGTKRN